MRLEKLDLIEWGWHRIGDPTKPKGGLLWGNPEWPGFWVVYDEFEGQATVFHRYSNEVSDEYRTIKGIYFYMSRNKDYKHEWEDNTGENHT